MKKLKYLLLVLSLTACTQESKIKSATEDHEKNLVEASLREESASLLPERKNLQSIYVHTFLAKTEIEFDQVEVNGDSAKADITIKTIAEPIRTALREIIGRVDSGRQDVFNVSDALKLVAGQMKLDQTIVSKKKSIVLKKSDGWKVQDGK